MKKRIAILGSTGSIGTQALEVISAHPDQFEAEVLTANNNHKLLIRQAITHKPNVVVIGNEALYEEVFEALNPLNIKVYAGEKSLGQIVSMESIDIVLMALVGFSGLKPTMEAIKAKKQIALANKECLVVAGEILTHLVMENHVDLIPVDSEHSAIFQCLTGEAPSSVEKLILTASGGPFKDFSLSELKKVNKQAALKHPNWNMGDKITIDSATLMNKGLEVIEARWLFGIAAEQIEVVIHPQSIIHSMVQFVDGSIKAQMGLPDMRLPIQYALSYPRRISSNFERFNFQAYNTLTFEQPDIKKFRNLAFAFEALKSGGNKSCILNAANEEVVKAFLEEKISFLRMPEIIEKCLSSVSFIQSPSFIDLLETDKEARAISKEMI
ncbi:MAG: 1-deoxy-D-xylulose-5-phosphate reductoisomerase [Bacteroidales bacterium]|nr:1-deoxy-D-xylulose-5-phosphate reductoisomerase [Bacteroidales bacterium]MCF8404942.1 1-deoxy-D-xylulose-5-phosphate reductoisomerase [Bacteroidales bacterium]